MFVPVCFPCSHPSEYLPVKCIRKKAKHVHTVAAVCAFLHARQHLHYNVSVTFSIVYYIILHTQLKLYVNGRKLVEAQCIVGYNITFSVLVCILQSTKSHNGNNQNKKTRQLYI